MRCRVWPIREVTDWGKGEPVQGQGDEENALQKIVV
jgi:hypothetical protein